MRRNLELTSRRAATGNHQRVGSRGVTQYYADNVIPLPSGSLPVPPLEPLDLAQAHFDKTLMLALLIFFGILDLLALLVWALFF